MNTLRIRCTLDFFNFYAQTVFWGLNNCDFANSTQNNNIIEWRCKNSLVIVETFPSVNTYVIAWSCQMMSVCRQHPDKMAHWAFLRTLFTNADMRILIRKTENLVAPSFFINFFEFYPDTDMRFRFLIRRREIAAWDFKEFTNQIMYFLFFSPQNQTACLT